MTDLTQAAQDVLAERSRQQVEEGFQPAQDDEYVSCQLARARTSVPRRPNPQTLHPPSRPSQPGSLRSSRTSKRLKRRRRRAVPTPRGGDHWTRKTPERLARGKKNGKHGRNKGTDNGNAKLSGAAVSEIRKRAAAGESDTSLAAFFGVARGAIWAIKTGKNWGQA